MKIVLWVGNESNQKALANKIHAEFPISLIITESRKSVRKITVSKVADKILRKLFLNFIDDAWWKMKEFYNSKYKSYPDVKTIDVENVNSDIVYDLTKNINPDIIIVSGTRLIKEKLISLKPTIGILNLHTGLSPYIKGGPNCTNWCIATNQFHLIGNTIMWLDDGIDSGNIITTSLTEFSGDESFADVHIKVMEQAHDLYLKSLRFLNDGKKSSVEQRSIAQGMTYYTKQWGLKEKLALLKNFKGFKQVVLSDEYKKLKQEVKTIDI